ncbi:dTMP kinase [Pelagibacteraceae bacterium]|nr:dTMP kinase [Pelagibacteraceae bacterium]
MGLNRGFFITFEGIEGSGKSTQIKLLYKFLKENISKKIFLTREPGGTKISEKIRKLVIKDLNEENNPLTELFLLFAARAEHYDLIKEKLKSGHIVLCDRYIDSTIAYQHFNGSIDLKLIHYLQKLIDKNIRPNLTILLDANPSISKKRMHLRAKKLDRFDRESLKKMNIIKKGFLAIAKMEKKRIFVLNGNTGMDLIHDKIKSKVLKSLIK